MSYLEAETAELDAADLNAERMNTELSAESVAEYLRAHPDFFVTRAALVDQLALPTQEQGTVSLVHLQLSRQRQRIEALEEEIAALIALAANNDRIFHDFMQLQDRLLRCTSLTSACEAIEQQAQAMNLRAYIRLLACDGDAVNESESYRLEHEHYQRFATNHLNGKSAYLGRMRKEDRLTLLGEHADAPELGSYVVLPLRCERPRGVLVFSSTDGGHFQPHMDTLFLRHLAVVFAHLLDTLPWNLTHD